LRLNFIFFSIIKLPLEVTGDDEAEDETGQEADTEPCHQELAVDLLIKQFLDANDDHGSKTAKQQAGAGCQDGPCRGTAEIVNALAKEVEDASNPRLFLRMK